MNSSQWQHYVLTIAAENDDDTMTFLNDMGRKEYGLAAVQPLTDGRVRYYFKRPAEYFRRLELVRYRVLCCLDGYEGAR